MRTNVNNMKTRPLGPHLCCPRSEPLPRLRWDSLEVTAVKVDFGRMVYTQWLLLKHRSTVQNGIVAVKQFITWPYSMGQRALAWPVRSLVIHLELAWSNSPFAGLRQ